MKKLAGLSWLFVVVLSGRAAFGQVREIDRAKLPQDKDVQSTYAQLSRYEKYGQTWTNNWTYDKSKQDVESVFSVSLAVLTEANKKTPDHHELQLLAALVAHFAYNVDVESAYEPAIKFLHEAALSDPSDYRTNWFLGIHECQSLKGVEGMPLLLTIEDSIPLEKLPLDFWNDYVTCATVTRMPAHSLRAIGRAIQVGAPGQGFEVIKGANERSFKASDVASTYPAHEAWTADGRQGDIVFMSHLCGVSFAAHANWGADIRDVVKGTCVAILQPPEYSAKVGKSSPSVMMMSRPAKPNESLSDFESSFLMGKYASAVPTLDAYCPSISCRSFEVRNKDMYANEGGAHLLGVVFERQIPEFDGLIFERPESPPKAASEKDKMVYFRADEEFQRFPGKMYYLVILDSNVAIFDAAKQDYDFFLKSMKVE